MDSNNKIKNIVDLENGITHFLKQEVHKINF